MSGKPYLLDPAAANDLREITRYTRKKWGKEQAQIYHSKLTSCMKAFANGNGIYKDMSEFQPYLRMGLCEHHYIFVQPRENAPAVVLAILHERMDIIQRLKARL